MRTHRTHFIAISLLIVAGALLWAKAPVSAPALASPPQPPPSGPITWSQPVGGGDWFYCSQAAADYVETIGSVTYTDWRLPTVAELQNEIQYGTVFGPFDPSRTSRYWSSRHQGNWGYWVDLGARTGRDYWNGLYDVRFVRP